MEIHVITPEQLHRQRLIDVASCVYPYVNAIHIRQKSWSSQEMKRFAHQLLEQGIPASKLVLNGHPLLALDMQLGGIHLPEQVQLAESASEHDCMRIRSSLRVGRSVHSMDGGKRAEQEGCDYVFFGHVYATSSKPGIPPRGLVAVKELCNTLHIPVIAIGGIQPQHVCELHAMGVAGIAVMSGIFEAEQPERQLERYQKELTKAEATKIQIGSDPE